MYRVIEHVTLRERVNNYKRPDTKDSMLWAVSEVGEAADELLMKDAGWVRNNPGAHPAFSKEKFGTELADTIYMLMLAGWCEGIDPIDLLFDKLDRKIREAGYVPNPEGRGWQYIGDVVVTRSGDGGDHEGGVSGTTRLAGEHSSDEPVQSDSGNSSS
jgi:hypothetical protein